jgi:hypothetical protein
MKILFVAINHFDPLCKPRLLRWLRDKAQQNAESPVFVGVDGDRGLFENVNLQRAEFRRLARETWPRAPLAFIDVLVEG